MTKVFISNKGNHDYSDALRFGELCFISDGIQGKFSINQMARLWKEALKDATKEDYILLTGLTIMNCIGCAVIAYKFGLINFLLFRNGKYLQRTLDLREET